MTDTLVTTAEGEPVRFTSKCRFVPHLQMAVAYTGIEQLGLRWSIALDERILSRDIEMLNDYTPEVLSEIWKTLGEEHDLRDMTSTIYHFGLAERTGRYVGYAYRSKDGFVSDQIPYGFGHKPRAAEMDDFVVPDDLTGWIALATAIRAEQAALPLGERVYIGGALTLTVLRKGTSFTSEIHRFDGFDRTWNRMNEYTFG